MKPTRKNAKRCKPQTRKRNKKRRVRGGNRTKQLLHLGRRSATAIANQYNQEDIFETPKQRLARMTQTSQPPLQNQQIRQTFERISTASLPYSTMPPNLGSTASQSLLREMEELTNVYREKMLEHSLDEHIVDRIIQYLQTTHYNTLIQQASLTNIDTSSKSTMYSVMETSASIVSTFSYYAFHHAVEAPLNTVAKTVTTVVNSTPLVGSLLFHVLPDISNFATFIAMACSVELKYLKDWKLYEVINWDATTADPNIYKRQVEAYNKAFVKSMKDIVVGVFGNTVNNCSTFIPIVLERIIHPKNVIAVSNTMNRHFTPEQQETLNYLCNTFITYYIGSIETTGSFSLDATSKRMLREIRELKIVKDALHASLKLGLRKFIEINHTGFVSDKKEALSLLEMLERHDPRFADFFYDMVYTVIVSMVKNVYQRMKELLNIRKMAEKMYERIPEVVHHPTTPPIIVASDNLSRRIEENVRRKVSIGEFVQNCSEAILTLLQLYDDEVVSHSIPEEKPYSRQECLLNVLDLKLDSILKDVCEVFAKKQLGDTLVCTNEFRRLAGEFYDRPISEIVDDTVLMRKILLTITFFATAPNKNNPQDINTAYASIMKKDKLSLFELYVLYNTMVNKIQGNEYDVSSLPMTV